MGLRRGVPGDGEGEADGGAARVAPQQQEEDEEPEVPHVPGWWAPGPPTAKADPGRHGCHRLGHRVDRSEKAGGMGGQCAIGAAGCG